MWRDEAVVVDQDPMGVDVAVIKALAAEEVEAATQEETLEERRDIILYAKYVEKLGTLP
jgi:predicted nucleic acid-binding protein